VSAVPKTPAAKLALIRQMCAETRFYRTALLVASIVSKEPRAATSDDTARRRPRAKSKR
jgi:hypothetical protein